MLSNIFKRLEKGEVLCVAAEVDDHLVANLEIRKGTGYSSMGFIGIAIKKCYRGWHRN